MTAGLPRSLILVPMLLRSGYLNLSCQDGEGSAHFPVA